MGKIITVCGGHGSGKTTVAVNLAYLLSQKFIVGILSTNMTFGSVQRLLNTDVNENNGLYSLITSKGDISKAFTPCKDNKNLFIMSLSNHNDCLSLADEELALSGDEAKELICEMRDMFQFLIVDCEPEINNPLSVYSLVYANGIINLIKPTVMGIEFHNSYKALFSALKIDTCNILHVVNGDKNFIGARTIERSTGTKLTAAIPYCREVEKAENTGVPVCRDKNGEFYKEIQKLADLIRESDVN